MNNNTKHRWDKISGFFIPEDGEKLQELAKDKICLEVGSLRGRSTACLAEVAKVVYAVDTFRASGNGAKQVKGKPHEFTNLLGFCTNMYLCGFTNIRMCVGLSSEISKTFDDNSLELVFIDGSHIYEDMCLDLKSWWPKLKMNNIMVFHDYGYPRKGGWPGTTRAIDDFLMNRVEKILGIAGDCLAWTKKETEYDNQNK